MKKQFKFNQTIYEIMPSLVGSEMSIRDRDESFPNVEWDKMRNLLQGEGGLEDILEDTILSDVRFIRAIELFNFATQVINARLEHIRTGFSLDPGAIRALVKIPAGVNYEKPEA